MKNRVPHSKKGVCAKGVCAKGVCAKGVCAKGVCAKGAVLCLALSLALVIAVDLLFPKGEEEVYADVIRLHILANSNSAKDQALKLVVRDEILKAGVFKSAKTRAEAAQDAKNAAKRAVEVADACLKERGAPYLAESRWGVESYPTRVYEGVRLPAGKYLSLRIVLGNGKGENWWCVLFPPLCIGAASEKAAKNLPASAVFDTRKRRYVFRFRLLEWLFS